jgi:hypothetical protein
MSNFHVGQQVVCVDDAYRDLGWRNVPNRPVKGRVYTVREVLLYEYFDFGAKPALRLHEIINPEFDWIEGRCEIAFGFARFRPVRKTSIEVFERMLIKAPEGVS